MPFFSPLDRQNIVNQFWSGGVNQCPHDGGRLEIHFHPDVAGYLLVVACHQCGSKAQVTRYSDPHRQLFRPWTAEEINGLNDSPGIAAQHCPVCSTGLRVHHGRAGEWLECARCGNTTLRGEPDTTVCAADASSLRQSVA